MHIQRLRIMNKTMDSFSPTFQWPISHGSSRWHRTKTDISIIIRRYCPALLYAIAVLFPLPARLLRVWLCVRKADLDGDAMNDAYQGRQAECSKSDILKVFRGNAEDSHSAARNEELSDDELAQLFYTYRCLNFLLFPAHILLREKLFK